ncbi:Transmembrane and coiled-coil domains-containing protein 3, partial [Quaeritorhiza haematococci]
TVDHDALASVNLTDIVKKNQEHIKKLQNEKEVVEQDPEVDPGKKVSKQELLDLKIQQLLALEDVVKKALDVFSEVVERTNHSDVDNSLKEESLKIINDFQLAVIKAKGDYLSIVESEKAQEKAKEREEKNSDGESTKEDGSPPSKSFVGNVLSSVAENADRLESNMKEKDAFAEGQKTKGSSIETVVKVEDDPHRHQKEEVQNEEENASNTTTGRKGDSPKSSFKSTNVEKKMALLIDSENNQYVLTKANDITVIYEDGRLLNDLMLLLLACFACSYVMMIFRCPPFFGHILAGILLGPTGYIRSLIQVETIARGLGVIFMMFFLGLEFNYTKIRKVWTVSLFGSIALLCITVVTAIMLGLALQLPVTESTVIGSSIFLSSTAVVIKSFASLEESESTHGRAILGILVMQDVILGVLLAILPALEQSGMEALHAVGNLFYSLAAFVVICVIIGQYPVRILLGHLRSYGNRELLLLGSIGVCVTMVKAAAWLGLSMELSCFVAGVVVSSRKSHSDALLGAIEPLRDVFASLFFASIGLHIYPSFLMSEFMLLMVLTATSMFFKYVVTLAVMFLLFRYDFRTSSAIAIGLCQFSEFTFLFTSRAKRYAAAQLESEISP